MILYTLYLKDVSSSRQKSWVVMLLGTHVLTSLSDIIHSTLELKAPRSPGTELQKRQSHSRRCKQAFRCCLPYLILLSAAKKVCSKWASISRRWDSKKSDENLIQDPFISFTNVTSEHSARDLSINENHGEGYNKWLRCNWPSRLKLDSTFHQIVSPQVKSLTYEVFENMIYFRSPWQP